VAAAARQTAELRASKLTRGALEAAEGAAAAGRKAEEPTDAAALSYPRSQLLSRVLSTAEWATVARAADFGHRELNDYDACQRKRRVAKAITQP
jgi:hypothetical protein